MCVRALLKHLDDLDMTIEKQKGKVSGEFLMRVVAWCDINDENNLPILIDYITNTILSVSDSRFKRVSKIGNLNAEKRKLAHVDKKKEMEMQEEFNKQIDAFVVKYLD